MKNHEYIELEHRPLTESIARGEIPPLDAAILNYLPMSILSYTSISRENLTEKLMKGAPLLWQINTTAIGRIGHIMTPCYSFEVIPGSEKLKKILLESIHLAGEAGARAVGLTGHLQKTPISRFLRKHSRQMPNKPKITTGRDAILGGMVLAYAGTVQAGGREISGERLAIVGVDKFSGIFLKLALKYFPHPQQITLVDTGGSGIKYLENLTRQLRGYTSSRVPLRVISGDKKVPHGVYESTFFVGVGPENIDIQQFQPGTLLLNLAIPILSFNQEKAMERMRKKNDILVQSGVLKMTHSSPNRMLFYSSEDWDYFYEIVGKVAHQLNVPAATDPYAPLNNCQYAPLITAVNKRCRPTPGESPTYRNSKRFFLKLRTMGLSSSINLLCGGKLIPPELVEGFRQKFGYSFNRSDQ
jgi:hypothetical protein